MCSYTIEYERLNCDIRNFIFLLLHISIKGGYTHRVQKWLKSQRRNVDHCRDEEEGGTALHWAAYHGRLDIVKLLIENGAGMLRVHNIALFPVSLCAHAKIVHTASDGSLGEVWE